MTMTSLKALEKDSTLYQIWAARGVGDVELGGIGGSDERRGGCADQVRTRNSVTGTKRLMKD